MKQALIKRVLVIVFLLLLTQCAFSQGVDLQNYVVTKWGLQEGLPQSSVNDILQTKDGYMWLATFGGLVRFDGNSFTTFNRSNSKGMRSDRILHLVEDQSGALWLTTENGFVKYKDGKFKTYLIKNENQIFAPTPVVEDGDGRLWITVDGSSYLYKYDQFVLKEVIKGEAYTQKALNNKTGALLAHKDKLLHSMGDSIIQIEDFKSRLGSEIIDFEEYPKNSGVFFLGTSRNGMVKYKNGNLSFYGKDQGLSSNFIKRVYVDKKDKLWVVTYNGVSTWNGNDFEVFAPIKSDYEINYSSFFEDREGNYWMGTQGEGLFYIQPSIVTTIDKDEGFDNDNMLSLSQLSDGRKLFSTNCGGIYEWFDGKLKTSVVNNHLPNLCVWSVFEDSKHRLWFGAQELYRMESLDLEKTGKIIGPEEGFTGYIIFSITEDSKGNIWIGSVNGLTKYDGETFRRFTTKDGLSYNDTRVIFEDTKKVLWVGTSSGLNKIKDGQITPVSLLVQDKAASENEPYVRAIYESSEGEMWIGTYGNGLFRINDNTICNISKADGLFDNIVSHLVEDEKGNFWMRSNRGIFRVERATAAAFCDGTVASVPSYSIGEKDGMISPETNGGFQPSTISDSSGKIFFPTVAGVSIVNTNQVAVNKAPPQVYIEKVRTTKTDTSSTKEITLPYDDAFLDINYTAINFTAPAKVQFKYKMQGLDDNWIDVGNLRQALYTKIPPGSYTFQVIASNSDGVWNTTGASLQILVVPPFWQKPWFFTLVGFLFIAAIAGVYYYRIAQLEQVNQQQKRFTEQLIDSQENERRRIASELHDGLGQQILVIKNRVEIARKSIKNSEEMKEQLDEIMQSAISSIRDVRSISHGLRPVLLEKFGLTDALTNFLEELQNTSSMEWSFHIDNIDNCIAKEKEIHFYRVLQEGTNNILKHSLANEASVIIKRTQNYIKATVWDDGKGFDVKMTDIFGGMGFLGMNERIETLSGTLEVQSTLGEGTQLNILIPIQQHA